MQKNITGIAVSITTLVVWIFEFGCPGELFGSLFMRFLVILGSLRVTFQGNGKST